MAQSDTPSAAPSLAALTAFSFTGASNWLIAVFVVVPFVCALFKLLFFCFKLKQTQPDLPPFALVNRDRIFWGQAADGGLGFAVGGRGTIYDDECNYFGRREIIFSFVQDVWYMLGILGTIYILVESFYGLEAFKGGSGALFFAAGANTSKALGACYMTTSVIFFKFFQWPSHDTWADSADAKIVFKLTNLEQADALQDEVSPETIWKRYIYCVHHQTSCPFRPVVLAYLLEYTAAHGPGIWRNDLMAAFSRLRRSYYEKKQRLGLVN